MLSSMNSIQQSFNIKYYENFYCNINSVIGKLRCLENNKSWLTEILKELFSIRDGKIDCRLTHGEVCGFLEDICLLY